MRKRSALFVLYVMILSASTVWSGIVLAGDKCITEPNLQSPPGSHWHYYTDRESHRSAGTWVVQG
jgi:hypothetical protein